LITANIIVHCGLVVTFKYQKTLISRPPNVFRVQALSGPAGGAYSPPPSPIPGLKRKGRDDKGGKRRRGKEREVEGEDRELSAISAIDLDPFLSFAQNESHPNFRLIKAAAGRGSPNPLG